MKALVEQKNSAITTRACRERRDTGCHLHVEQLSDRRDLKVALQGIRFPWSDPNGLTVRCRVHARGCRPIGSELCQGSCLRPPRDNALSTPVHARKGCRHRILRGAIAPQCRYDGGGGDGGVCVWWCGEGGGANKQESTAG